MIRTLIFWIRFRIRLFWIGLKTNTQNLIKGVKFVILYELLRILSGNGAKQRSAIITFRKDCPPRLPFSVLANIPGIEESHSNLSQFLFKKFYNNRICAHFIPFPIIMFRNTAVRHKRMYGCRKKRSNSGTFFWQPLCMPAYRNKNRIDKTWSIIIAFNLKDQIYLN